MAIIAAIYLQLGEDGDGANFLSIMRTTFRDVKGLRSGWLLTRIDDSKKLVLLGSWLSDLDLAEWYKSDAQKHCLDSVIGSLSAEPILHRAQIEPDPTEAINGYPIIQVGVLPTTTNNSDVLLQALKQSSEIWHTNAGPLGLHAGQCLENKDEIVALLGWHSNKEHMDFRNSDAGKALRDRFMEYVEGGMDRFVTCVEDYTKILVIHIIGDAAGKMWEVATTPDFCAIPSSYFQIFTETLLRLVVGVEASVTKYIAEAQRVLGASGLKFEMHGYGTGLEGEWSDVMRTIEAVHEALHRMGCPRGNFKTLSIANADSPVVATDIRIGTRVDKHGTLADKVASVRSLLEGKAEPVIHAESS